VSDHFRDKTVQSVQSVHTDITHVFTQALSVFSFNAQLNMHNNKYTFSQPTIFHLLNIQTQKPLLIRI